ncbi:hypothetical protein ACQP3C_28155, partial [Escherichia coli]
TFMLACHFFVSPLVLSIEGSRPGPGLGSRSGLTLVKFMLADMTVSIVRSFIPLVIYKIEYQRMSLEENVE